MMEADHVRKAFGGQPVLRDISLRVNKGDVITILGPSGSGKTTFLRCLNFLERADGGTLTLDGETLDMHGADKAAVRRLRKRTGFVFQGYNLFNNKTALQNTTEGLIVARRMPKKQAEEAGMEALRRVGLAERAGAYPAELSGGQQQRVAIARAMAADPEIIYFDEPTSALDPELVGEVLDVMRDLAGGGLTMLIVPHEMHLARQVSTRTLLMDGGLVVEENTPEEFFDHPSQERTRQFLRNVAQQKG